MDKWLLWFVRRVMAGIFDSVVSMSECRCHFVLGKRLGLNCVGYKYIYIYNVRLGLKLEVTATIWQRDCGEIECRDLGMKYLLPVREAVIWHGPPDKLEGDNFCMTGYPDNVPHPLTTS